MLNQLPHLPQDAVAGGGSDERVVDLLERDEPPPYQSLSDPAVGQQSPLDNELPILPESLESEMEPPLSDEECQQVARVVAAKLTPMSAYIRSIEGERYRVDSHLIPRLPMWQGRIGAMRLGIVIRHNVKQSWQKIGVWEPLWGIPGRNTDPKDDAQKWKWLWQEPPDYTCSVEGQIPLPKDNPYEERSYEEKLVMRALVLRRGLRRGQHVPVIPQSRLPSNATAAQAEAFLMSRPWFVFCIEVAEEARRLGRVWNELDEDMLRYSPYDQVVMWWKERGDWRDEYLPSNVPGAGVRAWKWRHESPSPEPEDKNFAAVDSMLGQPLDGHPHLIEFTPSEVDALEAAEKPDDEQSDNFWRATVEGQYSFPGQWAPRDTILSPLHPVFGVDGHRGSAELPFPRSPVAPDRAPRLRRLRSVTPKRAADEPVSGNEAPAKRRKTRNEARPKLKAIPKQPAQMAPGAKSNTPAKAGPKTKPRQPAKSKQPKPHLKTPIQPSQGRRKPASSTANNGASKPVSKKTASLKKGRATGHQSGSTPAISKGRKTASPKTAENKTSVPAVRSMPVPSKPMQITRSGRAVREPKRLIDESAKR